LGILLALTDDVKKLPKYGSNMEEHSRYIFFHLLSGEKIALQKHSIPPMGSVHSYGQIRATFSSVI